MGFRRIVALAACAWLLAGCRTIQVKPEAQTIAIHFDLAAVSGCAYLGEVVGSEGHWYASWLISNDVLTRAALNDLRNNAQAMGADTIFVPGNTLVFSSSVTILGQAWRCAR
jgi:hypothetical protein